MTEATIFSSARDLPSASQSFFSLSNLFALVLRHFHLRGFHCSVAGAVHTSNADRVSPATPVARTLRAQKYMMRIVICQSGAVLPEPLPLISSLLMTDKVQTTAEQLSSASYLMVTARIV